MKKIVLILMLGVLFIASNLFAANGDLIVDGNLSVGTDTPIARLDVRGDAVFIATNKNELFQAGVTRTDGGDAYLSYFGVNRNDAGNIIGETVSWRGIVYLQNGGNFSADAWITPYRGSVRFNSTTTGTSAVDSSNMNAIYWGNWLETVDNKRNYAFNGPVSVFHSTGSESNGGSGAVSFSDFRHVWLTNSTGGSLTKQTGLWIDKQTRGTDNYGIVLDGDGYGADITFGPNQEASIYSNSGELYAKDGANNVTLISPHDPKTGEWIFYSKNTKTGRVVRVNIEELVRDMEKLTGKKYLMESFVKDK